MPHDIADTETGLDMTRGGNGATRLAGKELSAIHNANIWELARAWQGMRRADSPVLRANGAWQGRRHRLTARFFDRPRLSRRGSGGISRRGGREVERSEEHTSELQSLMRISYAVFCLKKKKTTENTSRDNT